jgi:alginate O-acetyltransferase complex protein AlgI
MLFNSIYYIAFLSSVIIVLLLLRKKDHQHIFLILASCFFFFVSSNYYILLLFLASFSSYGAGIAIHRTDDRFWKKTWLAATCILLLGILGYFKYTNFAVNSLNSLFSSMNIVPPFSQISLLLPIGISFYTIEAVIYVIDIYRGTIAPSESLRDYFLYMAFFPKLIAGPIVRAWEFLPQLKDHIVITIPHAQFGVTLILWGLFKKVVIADNIGKYANLIFLDPVGTSATSFDIWTATFAFGIQIFCDFSGYTDIAIGTALILGIHLPQNFNRPYLSFSPAAFWRNWHITLSRVIKDYIYIPLGGSRKGRLRTAVNLISAWMVSGLWHGASWNFVMWGGFHGILLAVQKLFSDIVLKGRKIAAGPSTLFIFLLLTQYLIFLGWIFFRLQDPGQIAYCVFRYLVPDFILSNEQRLVMIGALVSVVMIWIALRTDTGARIARRVWNFDLVAYTGILPWGRWMLACMAIGILIIAFGPDAAPQFIYMRF